MKKGIQDNNPVLALWHRVMLDGQIYKLAREFRKKMEMPENGFKSSSEFDIWYKKFEEKKPNSLIELNIKLFIEKSKEIIPYEGIITDDSFKHLIMKFLIYDKIENDNLSSLKNSGMDVVVIKDGKSFSPYLMKYGGEIKEGVYIKITPFSTIDKILKYIESKKDLIKDSLKIYAESVNLKKPKRFKASSHFQRDFFILMADDEYSKKEIEKLFGIKAEYKDIAISSLMRTMGEKKMTSNIVKAVKQRRKIK